MFKIEAIIRPHRLEDVRSALQAIDLIGITVTDCRGEGRQRTAAHSFRGSQYAHHLDSRVIVMVAVTSENLDAAVNAIQAAATTGEVGDGKILVSELHEAVRIRTNERGESALS